LDKKQYALRLRGELGILLWFVVLTCQAQLPSPPPAKAPKTSAAPTPVPSLPPAATVASAAVQVADVQAAVDRLSRVLERPESCADLGPIDPRVAFDMGLVTRAVVCQQAGVRRGTGLATQARAAVERAQAQTQPAVTLLSGVDAQRRASAGWEASARLEWVLFDFGSRSAGLQQARQSMAAVLDEQRIEVLIAFGEAAQLLAAAQAASGRSEAADVNLLVAQDSARAADARHAAGAGTLVEKLQAQTALAQSQLEQSRASSQWLSAAGSLAIAMGLPPNQTIRLVPSDVQTDLDTAQNMDLAELMSEARQRHPRVSAARARLAEARARADAVDAERWGSVGLNASVGRVRSSIDADARNNSSVGLQWTLPLFDRGALQGRKGDALGQMQVREVNLSDALSQVELQVWQQGQALVGEREALRYSRAVLDGADAALRAATERYRRGVGGFNDVLAPQIVAANARFQWVEAQANLRRSQLRLAAAVGRFGPLTLR
jgi:outer membrane protein